MTQIVFLLSLSLAFLFGYHETHMVKLWKNASNQILTLPSDSTKLMSDDTACCCETVCCTECTDGSTVSVTAPATENSQCSLEGATLTDQTLTCINTTRGGEWPIPAGTQYYYGPCPSNITAYKLVVWCNNGTPEAFLWYEASEVITGEYTLVSCSSDPLEWIFQGGSVNGWACSDCAAYIIVTA